MPTNLTIILLLIFTIPLTLFAQPLNNEKTKTIQNENRKLIDSIYTAKLKNYDQFILGKLHIPKGNKFSHPYLGNNEWARGQIIFETQIYDFPLIKYDIETDALIILKNYGNTAYPIQLENSLISEFKINNRHFIQLKEQPNLGYLEEVYALKNVHVYVNWKKKHSYAESNTVVYSTNFDIILFDNNQYYKITSLFKIYKIYNNKKTELKAFKRNNMLRFSNDKLHTTLSLLEYYYSINEME